jgi:peptidyl-prolyl cis-trans isomerase SurA
MIALLALPSCTSAQSTKREAHQPKASEHSAEAQCLEDAAAPRTPVPPVPERIDVAHLLVRHKDLSNPHGSLLTREQACMRALAALETLQGGATWEGVVDEYSDSGRETHGSLGRVARDELSPAFGDAAFSLAPEELSYVVESDRGFHIILRIK